MTPEELGQVTQKDLAETLQIEQAEFEQMDALYSMLTSMNAIPSPMLRLPPGVPPVRDKKSRREKAKQARKARRKNRG